MSSGESESENENDTETQQSRSLSKKRKSKSGKEFTSSTSTSSTMSGHRSRQSPSKSLDDDDDEENEQENDKMDEDNDNDNENDNENDNDNDENDNDDEKERDNENDDENTENDEEPQENDQDERETERPTAQSSASEASEDSDDDNAPAAKKLKSSRRDKGGKTTARAKEKESREREREREKERDRERESERETERERETDKDEEIDREQREQASEEEDAEENEKDTEDKDEEPEEDNDKELQESATNATPTQARKRPKLSTVSFASSPLPIPNSESTATASLPASATPANSSLPANAPPASTAAAPPPPPASASPASAVPDGYSSRRITCRVRFLLGAKIMHKDVIFRRILEPIVPLQEKDDPAYRGMSAASIRKARRLKMREEAYEDEGGSIIAAPPMAPFEPYQNIPSMPIRPVQLSVPLSSIRTTKHPFMSAELPVPSVPGKANNVISAVRMTGVYNPNYRDYPNGIPTPATAINHNLLQALNHNNLVSVSNIAPYPNAALQSNPPAGHFLNLSQSIPNGNPSEFEGLGYFPYRGPNLAKPRVKPPFPVLIPSFAAWFSLDAIHQIEKDSLPEFFMDEKQHTDAAPRLDNGLTSDTYKSIRNFLIELYRSNPRVYLSSTTARREFAADVLSVTRVHAFLESWGIINYHVDGGTLPLDTMHTNRRSEFPILLHGPSGSIMPPTHKGANVDDEKNPLSYLYSRSRVANRPFFDRQIIYGASSFADPLMHQAFTRRQPAEKIRCVICSTQCEQLRYVCRQRASYVICPECYGSGRYDSLLVSNDFERVTDHDEKAFAKEKEWTKEENLKLLDALMQFGEDWDKVSEHVHSKTAIECATHFIQLPIEDPFLEQYYNWLGWDDEQEKQKLSEKAEENARAKDTEMDKEAKKGDHMDIELSSAAQPSTTSALSSSSSSSTSASSSSASASSSSSSSASSSSSSSASVDEYLPFQDSQNPLMALLSFLSANISPTVGAAGAQAALQFLFTPDEQDFYPSAEALVQTRFGAGTLVNGRVLDGLVVPNREDGIVEIRLPFGSAYCHFDSVRVHPSEERARVARAIASLRFDSTRLQAASRVAFRAAKEKARELAEEEDRKLLRSVAQVVQLQMTKIDLKMQQLEEVDNFISMQKAMAEKNYVAMWKERRNLLAQKDKSTISQLPATSMPTQPATASASPAPAVHSLTNSNAMIISSTNS